MSITSRIAGNSDARPSVADRPARQTIRAIFQTLCSSCYVVYNIKFLENIKQGFIRTISWNKYRSEIAAQSNNNNLDYMIDVTFTNINRLFVLSFKNGNDDPTRNYFDKYCKPLVEMKDVNVLIDNKPFFDQSVKNKQEAYEEMIEMTRHDN